MDAAASGMGTRLAPGTIVAHCGLISGYKLGTIALEAARNVRLYRSPASRWCESIVYNITLGLAKVSVCLGHAMLSMRSVIDDRW